MAARNTYEMSSSSYAGAAPPYAASGSYASQAPPYPSQSGYAYPPQAGYPPQGAYPPAGAYSFKAGPPSSASMANAQGPPRQSNAAPRPSHHAIPVAQPAGATVDKPVFRDVWALVLFICNLCAFIGVSVAALVSPATETPFMPQDLLIQWIYALLVVAAVSLVFGIIYTVLMRYLTRAMMIASIILSCLLMILYAIYFIIFISIVVGILFLLFAVFYAFVLFMWRHRIPFAVILVTTVMDTIGNFPATIFVASLAILINLGVSVLCTFVVIYMFNVWYGAALICLCVYYVFGFYWISQVIKNVMHITIAGAFATFYFYYNSPDFPRNPVAKSAKRALSYSFGSVCFGSLLVALVQTIHFVLRTLASGHWLLELFVNCIMGCIEGLLRYFNMYAFTQVAIYGKSYCNAGRDTFALFGRVGMDAVANDSLVDKLLNIAVMFTSFLGFGVAWAWAELVAKTDNYNYILLFAFSGLLVGALIMSTVTETINSGVVSTFVCLAENPQALQRTRPALYQAIRSTYQNLVL